MYQHHWKNRLLQTLRPLQQRVHQFRHWFTPQDLTLTTGQLAGSDQEIRMLTLGSSKLAVQAFFDAGHTRAEVLGTAKPLQAAQILRRYQDQVDLLLLPVTPLAAAAPPDSLLLPDYLDATILFTQPAEQWQQQLRELNKRGLKQAAKRPYQWRTATSLQDYQLFYHQMLKPYVQQRHGYNAFVESCEEFCADTYGAVLMLAELDGKPLAGFHLKLSPRNPLAYFNKIGLTTEASADKHIMRELNCLIYQRMVELAREAGHHGLHLGMTPPVLDNGITWYKAGWGASFTANLSHQYYRLLFTSDKATLIQQHAHPLITLKQNRLHGHLWCTPENREQLQEQAKGWQFRGLESTSLYEVLSQPRR